MIPSFLNGEIVKRWRHKSINFFCVNRGFLKFPGEVQSFLAKVNIGICVWSWIFREAKLQLILCSSCTKLLAKFIADTFDEGAFNHDFPAQEGNFCALIRLTNLSQEIILSRTLKSYNWNMHKLFIVFTSEYWVNRIGEVMHLSEHYWAAINSLHISTFIFQIAWHW